jgi:hypothetical protein
VIVLGSTNGEPLGEVHVRTSSSECDLVVEVGRVHDQHIAVPATHRVTQPLTNRQWQMGSFVERNDACIMDHFAHERHVVPGLHNLKVVVVENRPMTKGATALARIVKTGSTYVAVWARQADYRSAPSCSQADSTSRSLPGMFVVQACADPHGQPATWAPQRLTLARRTGPSVDVRPSNIYPS